MAMADTDTTISKTRIDAWDATLTEAQRWQVYDRMRTAQWYDVAAWAAEEFGLATQPSRSGLYRFASRMRGAESAHRIERALAARDEAGALVAARTDDAATVAAYKVLAQDLALSGDAENAIKLTRMALDIAAQQTKAQEIELKAAQLKLAQDKFKAAEARLGEIRDVTEDLKLSDEERTARIKEIFGL